MQRPLTKRRQALWAYGHPKGLHLTLLDPDVISPTNCVRQPFSQSEIGLYRSVVLANRLNLFWGVDWRWEHLDPQRRLDGVDIVGVSTRGRGARQSQGVQKIGVRLIAGWILATTRRAGNSGWENPALTYVLRGGISSSRIALAYSSEALVNLST